MIADLAMNSSDAAVSLLLLLLPVDFIGFLNLRLSDLASSLPNKSMLA